MASQDFNATNDADGSDLLDTLIIYSRTKRLLGGMWVDGSIAGHTFTALVFEGHADLPDWELGDSRISKLQLRADDDRTIVADFDRGWIRQPTTPAAQQIVDLLAAGLAETVSTK